MTHTSIENLVTLLACPSCGGALKIGERTICLSCHKSYTYKGGKIYFLTPPTDFEDDGNGPNVTKEGWGAWRRHNFDYFAEHLAGLADSAVVLDLGAGPGQFGELTNRFANLISVDVRPFTPVNVITDLTGRLPLQDQSIDAVMASNVLEHIPNTAFLMTELHRVLKPGGLFVATIPFLMRVHQKPYDFNRYTNYQLETLLNEAGFTEKEVKPLSSPLEVYKSMERHFYATVFESASPLIKFLLRTIRFWGRLRFWVLDRLAPKTSSFDYTEGYGLTARK
jgi:SAM-dependent methyltransferase